MGVTPTLVQALAHRSARKQARHLRAEAMKGSPPPLQLAAVRAQRP